MSELTTPPPETDDDLNASPEDVDALGGDGDVLESLPENADDAGTAADDADALGGDGDIIESLPQNTVLDVSEDSPFLTFHVDEVIEEVDADEMDAYGELDIEAALAAVSSLSDAQAEREAEEAAAAAVEAEREQESEAEEFEAAPPAPLKSPPPLTLRRGQLGSVIPALTLMGVGAWLTLSLTTDVGPLNNPVFVLGVVGAALILILTAQWLASRRWTRGILFVAVLALLLAGALYEDMVLRLGMAGPLTLAALGGAFVLTGALGRPPDRRLFLPGLLLLVGGAVAAVVSRGLLPGALPAGVAPYWWVVAAVLVVIWLLPVIFGRRNRKPSS